MYKNAAINMNESETLDGQAKPAQGVQGRIVSWDEKAAKALSPQALESKAVEFNSAAMDTKSVPRWMGGYIDDVRKNIPDLSTAKASTILSAYGSDFKHVAQALAAKKDGRYLEFTHDNSTSERGIVAEVNGQKTREGLWLGRDQEGHVRQIASFKAGKPDGAVLNLTEKGGLESSVYYKEGVLEGTSRQYNNKGEVTHRTIYSGGEAQSSQAVDPSEEKAARDNRAAQFKAMNTMKVGR